MKGDVIFVSPQAQLPIFMQQRIILFFKLMLFWLVYMILVRAVFIVYNADQIAALTTLDVIKTAIYGFRMDTSMVGYFMAAYGLILSISSIAMGGWARTSITLLTYFLLFICTLIVVVGIPTKYYTIFLFRIGSLGKY
jgi:hypothetical protein